MNYDLLFEVNNTSNSEKTKFLIKFTHTIGEKLKSLSQKIQDSFEEILLEKLQYRTIEIDTIFWEKKTLEERKNIIISLIQ